MPCHFSTVDEVSPDAAARKLSGRGQAQHRFDAFIFKAWAGDDAGGGRLSGAGIVVS